MGVLIDGEWADGELPQQASPSGASERPDSVFRDRVTADGASALRRKWTATTCTSLTGARGRIAL
jgi:glutathionyl-hydroquinone reductase